jgi:hypothetical protein
LEAKDQLSASGGTQARRPTALHLASWGDS